MLPAPITKILAGPWFKYVVAILSLIAGSSTIAVMLKSDGYVQASMYVSVAVAMAGHLLQFLAASGLPSVTVSAAPAAQVKVDLASLKKSTSIPAPRV